MPKEPDNVVLKLLREIRETQSQHSEEFKKVRKQLEDLSESVTYSLGLAAHSHVRHETVQKKLDELEKRLKKLEARA